MTLTRLAIPRGFWREVFFNLAVMALVFRALIPVGFMPDFSAKGDSPTLTICAGYDGYAHIPDTDIPLKDKQTKHTPLYCGFSFNAGASVPQAAQAALPQFHLAANPLWASHGALEAYAVQAHASRAPPSIA
ncbi:MAG: hypothetical protein KGQ41_00840 [Alphaproteobacteria bacterium]|nr:hypothetical protein [Alphaproteobacteria bacterium]